MCKMATHVSVIFLMLCAQPALGTLCHSCFYSETYHRQGYNNSDVCAEISEELHVDEFLVSVDQGGEECRTCYKQIQSNQGDFVFVERGCLHESLSLPESGSQCENNVRDEMAGDKGTYCVCAGDRCNTGAPLPVGEIAAILTAILGSIYCI